MKCPPYEIYNAIQCRRFVFLVQKVVNGETTKYTLKTHFISGRVSASIESQSGARSSQVRRLDPKEMRASTFKNKMGSLYNSVDINALDAPSSDILKLTSNMSPQDEEQVSKVEANEILVN